MKYFPLPVTCHFRYNRIPKLRYFLHKPNLLIKFANFPQFLFINVFFFVSCFIRCGRWRFHSYTCAAVILFTYVYGDVQLYLASEPLVTLLAGDVYWENTGMPKDAVPAAHRASLVFWPSTEHGETTSFTTQVSHFALYHRQFKRPLQRKGCVGVLGAAHLPVALHLALPSHSIFTMVNYSWYVLSEMRYQVHLNQLLHFPSLNHVRR